MNNDHRFSSDELLKILSLSPNATAIYTTNQLIIQTANDAMIALWGKDRSVIGQRFEDAIPELKGQQFIGLLQNVLKTGRTYQATNTPATLRVKGKLQTSYFDFIYRAIKNENGETYCILHTATDVTERYLNQQTLANAHKTSEALTREQALNEELAATNEELNAINEELKNTQDKLQLLNAELETRVTERTRALTQSESNFKNMILQAPVAIGLFKGHDMVLDMINDKFLELWNRDQSIIGQPLELALPELKDQPFLKIMQGVYNGAPSYFGNEAEVKLNRKGKLETGFYNFVNHPFKDDQGNTIGIIVVASEVTDQVNAGNKVKASEQRLHNMVMSTPINMAIFEGRDLIVTIANLSMLNIWSRTAEQVLGKKLLEIFPELIGQPFPQLLQDVFDTGQRVAISEIEVDIATAEGTKHLFVNFSYDPLFNQAGEVESILASVVDITDMVNARKQLEESEAEQLALNEEITAANEEMAATNEELYATNEELSETQLDLKDTINKLAESEGRLRYMLADAPIAIALMTGRDLVVEAANKMVLQAWGKDYSILGKPLKVAVPELAGQEFLTLLDEVFVTGVPYYGNEVRALLEQNGVLEEVYSNFVYHPLKNHEGQTTSIVLVANVVTEQVVARKKVEEAEEKTRFAIEAANVGTWFLNIETHEFVISPRLKEQFGYYANEDVSYEQVSSQIPEDYRDKVLTAIADAIATGRDYSMEHPVVGFHDQKTRWLRALGKLYPDATGKLSHFSGLIIDITEQKQDEMRKNDFIGMVSHELKTPLTSLSAYAQMLHARAQKAEDNFSAGALEKVNTQVKKMSTMINGFLNVSRLESGKIFLSKHDFALDDLVQEMIADTMLTIASHTITLTCAEPLAVHADRDKIGSVLSNLLSNAIKYSPRGKNITVECKAEGNMALISVTDEGMGIKAHDIDRIFDRYYRVESNHTQTISGFGIGLYLCAEIVQRHDGQIGVESQSGKGSTFYFTLPLN